MNPVAFFSGHGPRGRRAAARAVALLQPSETVLDVSDSPDLVADTERIAAQVAGMTVVRVIHFVEVEDEGVRERVAEVTRTVQRGVQKFPALLVAQFVVALADREWDADELETLVGLGDDVGAILVVSRSNEAVALLRETDEECMAADVGFVLAAATRPLDLEGGRFWLVGASAVHYRRGAIVGALVAYRVLAFLRDDVLAPLSAQHTECDEATAWVARLTLASEAHMKLLDAGPTGKSEVASLRLDRDLFRTVPPEYLLDTLLSFAQRWADDKVGTAREQVERSRLEHQASVLVALESDVVSVLRRNDLGRIARARRYLDCMADGLDSPLAKLQVALTRASEDDELERLEMEAVEIDLANTIRRLPYPASVATRTAGLGALGLMAYHLMASLLSLNPNYAVLGMGAGILLGIPLLLRYQYVRDRISWLRERYLELAERRAQGRVAAAVLEAAAAEVRTLQAEAQRRGETLGGRLAELEASLEQLAGHYDARVDQRSMGDLTWTSFSQGLPSTRDASTARLAEEFPLPLGFDLPALVVRSVLPHDRVEPIDTAALDEELIAVLTRQLDGVLWPSLEELLQSSSASHDTATSVLGRSTAPIVQTSLLATDMVGLRRRVARVEPVGAGLQEVIATTAADGIIAIAEADSAVQIALRLVPPRMLTLGEDPR